MERAGRYAGENGEAAAALENLRRILVHLEAVGCLDGVMLDFGLIGRHDYYTGAVYEVYASGLGFTVANGGRYDNLLRRFGEPMPATGFAISLERLVSVLPDEEPPPLVVLVGASVEATRTAARLRDSGVPVLHLAEDLPPAEAAEYARSVDAGWVCYPAPDGVKLAAANGGEAEILPTEAVSGRVIS
jgi:ATP phosphoribosyltransferase regulatory subunit